ncbi:MAG: transposase [Verrucomicrobia bacterium]|nr:transposase [Verrucomicrobiota bacterium]
MLAEMPFVLHAWLRAGNTGAGRGVVAFLQEALALLPQAMKIRCVSADSGFFDQKLLSFLEERGISYIVVARLSPQIKRQLCGIREWIAVEDGIYEISSFGMKLGRVDTGLLARTLPSGTKEHAKTHGRDTLCPSS